MEDKPEINAELHQEKSALMDELCDANDCEGIIRLCQEFNSYTHKSARIRMHTYYNMGSGYSYVASKQDNHFGSVTSGLALLNFRKALAECRVFAKESLKKRYSAEEMVAFYDLRSRLITNLANELDHQGRRLEALALYQEPIDSGNIHAVLGKGRCLTGLAHSFYDYAHAFYLRREAAACFIEALARIDEFPISQKQAIESTPFYSKFLRRFAEDESDHGNDYPKLDDSSGGKPHRKDKQAYFAWCAVNRLFINELNVISTSHAVYSDILTLPTFSTRFNPLLSAAEELRFHGHFDEMKTDYCYARYLAYLANSISLFDDHFFNSTFAHVDTLDYEINNLKTNHLKSCFRISYSIFDKISFFLHRFFELDKVKNDHMVDFKKVWFKPGSQKLKDIFQDSDNEHFRALYFISHEIRQGGGNTPVDEDSSYWFDPDTERLFKIRNAMEHRSLKLVDGIGLRALNCHKEEVDSRHAELDEKRSELKLLKEALSLNPDLEPQIKKIERRIFNIEQDLLEKARMGSYSLVIGVEEFEALTIKLLTLAKDALIYLSLAVHHEESKKPADGITISNIVPKK